MEADYFYPAPARSQESVEVVGRQPGSVRTGCLQRHGKNAYAPPRVLLFVADCRTVIDASLGEILTTCSKMEWLINHGEQVLRPETRSNPLMLSYKKCQVRYEPLGVVAGIVSWNYRKSFSCRSVMDLTCCLSSLAQCLVSDPCCHLCWEWHCSQVLRTRHLVNYMVHRRDQSMS